MKARKHALRAKAVFQRESLSRSQLTLWGRLIQARALQFSPYRDSPSVTLYSPIGNEVRTEEIRDHALENGKRLFYPRLGSQKDWHLVRLRSAEELKPGRYGILEPLGAEFLTDQDREGLIVFVPGLVFDIQGNRLGRGKGWYDRILGELSGGARFVALAYEFQVVENVPAEAWDQRIHYIITEQRIIDCGGPASRSGWLS